MGLLLDLCSSALSSRAFRDSLIPTSYPMTVSVVPAAGSAPQLSH